MKLLVPQQGEGLLAGPRGTEAPLCKVTMNCSQQFMFKSREIPRSVQ